METLKEIEKIIGNLFLATNSSFTGLYYEEEVVFFKTINKEKEKILPELISLLVRKFIKSDDLIGSPEYLFTEGKGYAIFLFNAGNNITLVTVIEGKPNFSLLRLGHNKASQLLKGLSKEIPSILEEKQKVEERKRQGELKKYTEGHTETPSAKTQTKQQEDQVPEKQEEKRTEKQALKQKETTDEEEKEKINEDIKELEEIFSSTSEETIDKQKKESIDTNEKVKEPKEVIEKILEEKQKVEEREETPFPSLEEILLSDEALSEGVNPEIVENIRLKFIEGIGPVGKILFKKVVEKVDINLEKPYRHKVEELIEKLSEEITVESRKEDFLKNCRDLL